MPHSTKQGAEYVLSTIQSAEQYWPSNLCSDNARVLLLATSGQESEWKHQKQINGPARGLWQFEKAGGVYGVMTHPSTKDIAKDICKKLGVSWDASAIYKALSEDLVSDMLDASFARLLYFANPKPLPTAGYVNDAWQYYIATWRPGKPRYEHWKGNYAVALSMVTGKTILL